MLKTYKYKLYSSKRNKSLEEQTKICGNIYNHCISLKLRYYQLYGKSLSKYQLQKHLTKLKKLPKYSFWNKVGSQAIQDITDRIERGYIAFFKNCKKKTKTRKVSPPSFKNVRGYSSFTLKQAGYSFNSDNDVRIGRETYKYFKSRETKGEIKTVTVKRDKVGDWFIFVTCRTENNTKEISKTGKTAGFDFGCMTFLTASDETKIQSPLFMKKAHVKLAQASRSLSRKKRGSNNRKKAKIVGARIHRKIANQRRDWHFKTAHSLLKDYDILCFEDLNLKGIAKLHGKKIGDMGFGEFVSILSYLALIGGKEIRFIDRWFPSTKLCSICEYKNEDLTKRDRTWECPECGTFHDRDINAAVNIHSNAMNFSEGASSDRRESISSDKFRQLSLVA